MGTVLVGAALAGVLGLVIRSMIQDRKKGINLQCGRNCSHCSGCCGKR